MREPGAITVWESILLVCAVGFLLGSFGLIVAGAGSTGTDPVSDGPVTLEIGDQTVSALEVSNETLDRPAVTTPGDLGIDGPVTDHAIDRPSLRDGNGSVDQSRPLRSYFYQPAPPTNDSPLLFSDRMPIAGVEIYGEGGTGVSDDEGYWSGPVVDSGEYIQHMYFEGYPFFDAPDYLRVYRYTVPDSPAWIHFWMPCGRYYQGPDGLYPPPPEPPEEDHGGDNPNVPVWEPGISVTNENPEVGEPITISGCDPFVALDDYELEWDLDDGTILPGDEIVHTFDEPGVYEIGPHKGAAHRVNVTVGDLEITRALPDEWFTDEVEEYYRVSNLDPDRTLVDVTVGGVSANEIDENDFRVALDPFAAGDEGGTVDVVAEFDDGEVLETTEEAASFRQLEWVLAFNQLFDSEPGSGEWCALDGGWPDGERCELRHEDAFDWHPHEDGFVFDWAGIPNVPLLKEGLEVRLTDRTLIESGVPDGDLQGEMETAAKIGIFGGSADIGGAESLDFDGIDFLGSTLEEHTEAGVSVSVLSDRQKDSYSEDGLAGADLKVAVGLDLTSIVSYDEQFGIVERSTESSGELSGFGELSILGAAADVGVSGGSETRISQQGQTPVETVEYGLAADIGGSATLWGLVEGEVECGIEWENEWDVGPDSTAATADEPDVPAITSNPFYCDIDWSGWYDEHTDSTAGMTLRDARGTTVFPTVASVDGDAANAASTRLPTASGEDLVRLTDRPYEDTEPSIAATDSGHAVSWSYLPDGADTADGNDVIVRLYDDETGWSDPISVTADDRHDIEPALASPADSEDLLAVWTRLSEPADSFDDPDEIAAHFDIAMSRFDGDSWSDPEFLTDSEALDRAPVVEATDDGWAVAWHHHPNSDRLDLANASVEYRLLDSAGSVDAAGTIENASLPALGLTDDGAVELAYYAAEDWFAAGSIGHGTIDADGFDAAAEYAVVDYVDHDVDGESLLWATATDETAALWQAIDGEPNRLPVESTLLSLGHLSVDSTDDETVISYRGTPEGQTTTDVFYRSATDGTWSGERRATTGFDENASVQHADAIATADGLVSVYTLREPMANNRNDIFQSTVEFGPAFDVDVTGPTNATAGETVSLEATVRNVGSTDSDEGTLLVTDGETELATESVEPLASNETSTYALNVTVPDHGIVEVTVKSSETGPTDEWYAQNATLALGAPDLAITAVDAEPGSETGTPTNGTVAVELENRGGVDAAGVPIRLTDGDEWTVDETVSHLATGDTIQVEVPITTDSFNTTTVDRVRIDPDGLLDERATQPRYGTVTTRLFAPTLGVHQPIRYSVTEHFDGDREAEANVLVSNRGPIDANATVTVRDLDTGAELGAGSIALSAPVNESVASDRLSVELTDVSEGRRLGFAIADDATGNPSSFVTDEVSEIETDVRSSLTVSVANEHTGEAVENATVTLLTHPQDRTHATNATGSVSVEVPDGDHVAWISKPGFDDAERAVRFTRAGSALVTANLTPTVSVSDVDSPSTVDRGASVTVTATIENDGDAPTETVATLRADGSTVGEKPVEIDPNGERTVSFEVTAPDDRAAIIYEVAVGDSITRSVTGVGLDDSVDTAIAADPLDDGDGSLSITDVTFPSRIGVDETPTLWLNVTNEGADPVVDVATVTATGGSLTDRPVGAAVVDLAANESTVVPIDVSVPSQSASYDFETSVGSASVTTLRFARDAGDLEWRASTDDAVWSSPTIYDEAVLVGSENGTVSSLDRENGSLRWTADVGGPSSASPTAADGVVYAGSTDGLFALDAETGDVVWHHETSWDVHSSPTVADGTVYAASLGVLYALDADTGAVEWTFVPEGGTESSPVVVDGTVYIGAYGVADDDGFVHAIDAGDGTETWRTEVDGQVTASPTVKGGLVYVGSHDGGLYALDATSGSKTWRFDTGGAVHSSPTVSDGRVYVGTGFEEDDNGAVFALDASTGTQAWSSGFGRQQELLVSSPTVADGTVYVGSQYPYVHAFEADSGTQLWRQSMPSSTFSSPTVADGTLYIGSMDGSVNALNVRGDRTSEDSRVEQESLGHIVSDEAGPQFEVTVTGTNSPITAGESLEVTALIDNVGTGSGTQSITLEHDGDVHDSVELELAAGASESVTLEWVTNEADPGSTTVVVASDDDSESADVVIDPAESVFAVEIAETNDPVVEGETLVVSAAVENVGDGYGTQSVELAVNSTTVDSAQVDLDAGESTTIDLGWETDSGDAGSHPVAVASDDESDATTVTVTAAESAFEVGILETNSPVTAGETLTVTTQIDNTGGGAGTQTVDLAALDGTVVDATNVTLDAGESIQSQLTWDTAPDDVGTGAITVSSADSLDTANVSIDPACALPGDVDGDGAVTSLDATLTLQYIAGLDPDGFVNPECGDLTGDGEITTEDVVMIYKILVGIAP
ncbi:PQQ-binding-like beta-propeller repeat protein [Halovivax gelatinilyticus]|uniref:outer membrane protein assembly factor BamB family protein n=1 Tax=Halovivax gelatinilyticus TaxID=2961597 RepID=UPI0020CA374C|nr:PQQ-binding-like beta-propeller repeat protein [Halovivax gelatinilyticus]